MPRAPIDQALWQPWIDHVCVAMDVDPALVDVSAIHALTGRVAGTFARPMAPVSAHLYGIALGAGMAPDAARTAIHTATDAAAKRADSAAVPIPDVSLPASHTDAGTRAESSVGSGQESAP